MTAALILALTGAAALTVLALHLRASSARSARRFPSLQFVPPAARSVRIPAPIEDRGHLLLRLLALLVLAAAFLFVLRDTGRRKWVAVVADPNPGTALMRAREIALEEERGGASPDVVVLGFEGDTPVIEGGGREAENARARARRILEAPAPSKIDALRRAAAAIADETVIVSDFGPGFTAGAGRLPFRAVRVAASATSASARPVEAPLPDGAARRVVFLGGAEEPAALWAAAIGEAEGVDVDLLSAEALSTLDIGALVVTDTEKSVERPEALAFAERGGVVVLAGGGDLVRVEGIRYDGVARGGAGRAADAAVFETSFPKTARQALAASADGSRVVLDLSNRGKGRVLEAAGTALDCARLLHEGTLGRLARVAFQVVRGARGAKDVRAAALPAKPLDDAALTALGGSPYEAPRPAARPWPFAAWLFGIALFLRILDGRRGAALLELVLIGAEIVFLLVLVLAWRPSWMKTEKPLAAALGARPLDVKSFERAGWDVEKRHVEILPEPSEAAVRNETRPLAVYLAAIDASPAVEPAAFAGASFLSAPVVLLPGERPAPSLAAVDAPARVVPGETAEAAVTLEIPRGAGAFSVELADRGGVLASVDVPERGPGIRRVALPIVPAAAGPRTYAVRLRGAAPDAVLFAVEAVARRRRVLLVSSAPSWEARRLAEDISNWADVEREAGVGKATAFFRGAAGSPVASPRPGLDELFSRGHMAGLDAVILDSAGPGELTVRAQAALVDAVRSGAAVLLTGIPAKDFESGPFADILPARLAGAAAFPADPVAVAGTIAVDPAAPENVAFQGFPPPAWRLAPGATVLATLGRKGQLSRPWLAGTSAGKGRVARFLAPDLWRLPEARRRVFLRSTLAWLWAAHDAALAELPVPPEDEAALLVEGRARLRRAAALSGSGLFEAASADDAAGLVPNLASPPPRRVFWDPRRSPAMVVAVLSVMILLTHYRRRASRARSTA
jgi:hypothetical protein